ncbi:MAG: hypothetical protein KAT83_02810 [Candidatus Aenigmarchaeota archaeon]|nr:hypothetical protein [Candidatus Aenigmarchaeota archaeon]
MAYMSFMGLMSDLESMGFVSFVLPWLLFLIIIDAVLYNVAKDTLGIDKRKSTLLAAILSFFIVNFTPAGVNMGVYLTQLFGAASMYIAGLLVFILFLGMGGFKITEIPGGKNTYMLILFLIALLVFSGVAGIPFISALSASDMTLLFMIALVVAVIWALSSEKGETPAPK